MEGRRKHKEKKKRKEKTTTKTQLQMNTLLIGKMMLYCFQMSVTERSSVRADFLFILDSP